MIGSRSLRKELIAVCHLMHQRGLIAAADGNVSVRFDGERILTTPSGFNKGLLSEDDLCVTDLQGRLLHGLHKPSSELRLHLAVYTARTDVRAVVHAHPPTCVALSIAGIGLLSPLLPEVVLSLGEIPTAPYATPTTADLPETIRTLIPTHDAILLERHGSLTVGKDLTEAYNRLECMEHAATVIFLARQLGNPSLLPATEVAKLRRIAAGRG
ncbi:MAG: hypothetical protein A2284_15725 [Deltaproteobacteria bacterium RIFOXYA12_FULL_61_11]|nr:MAG: hypothetical protein A2284_15725 [Deltaproteobacteria bacterium RIFOXYA12_FULL_61_11]